MIKRILLGICPLIFSGCLGIIGPAGNNFHKVEKKQEIVKGSKIFIKEIGTRKYVDGYIYKLSNNHILTERDLENLKDLCRLKKIKNPKLINLLSRAYIVKDKFKNSYTISFMKNSIEDELTTKIIVTKDDVILKEEFTYSGRNWIFAEKIKILVNGKMYNFNNFKFNRQVMQDTTVLEWTSIISTVSDIKLLEKIATSDETIIRFIGSDVYSDKFLIFNIKSNIKNTLEIYKLLIDN